MSGAVARKLDQIAKRAAITGRDIAQLLDTTPETVSRWRAGKVEPQRERLHRLLTLEWLVENLEDLYPDPEEAKLWLFGPHRLLAGQSPADRIRSGQVDDVLAIIEQLRTGAYV